LIVWVEAEGSYGLALIASKGFGELGGYGGIAGSGEGDEKCAVAEFSGETVSTSARKEGHCACTCFRCEGK